VKFAVMSCAHRCSSTFNDALAGKTKKQIFFDCVWISEDPEDTTAVKLMLLCIGRFFDDDAESSSMSNAQVSRECGLHERSAKRIAEKTRGRWLRIAVKKGYHVPGKGNQNLYSGICPPELVALLRETRQGQTCRAQ
jgi:hypothetical protein